MYCIYVYLYAFEVLQRERCSLLLLGVTSVQGEPIQWLRGQTEQHTERAGREGESSETEIQ